MTDIQKLKRLKAVYGTESDDVLNSTLITAKVIVLNYIYGLTSNPERELSMVESEAQIEIAIRLLDKRGAGGETSHNENGISRSWADPSGFTDVFHSWRLTPYVGGIQ